MNTKRRIQLTDNFMTACMALAEGNPGAITALVDVAGKSPKVDPDSAFGVFGPLLFLDTKGIYGSHIWVLYKDVCGQDAINMLMLHRCIQLGLVPANEMFKAMKGTVQIDFADLKARLKVALPNFNPDNV